MKVNVIIRDAVWEIVSFYCYKWEGVGLENSLMVMLVVMPAILKKFMKVLVGQVNDGEVRQMDWRVSKGFYLMKVAEWFRIWITKKALLLFSKMKVVGHVRYRINFRIWVKITLATWTPHPSLFASSLVFWQNR